MRKMYKQPQSSVSEIELMTVLCGSITNGGGTDQFIEDEVIND